MKKTTKDKSTKKTSTKKPATKPASKPAKKSAASCKGGAKKKGPKTKPVKKKASAHGPGDSVNDIKNIIPTKPVETPKENEEVIVTPEENNQVESSDTEDIKESETADEMQLSFAIDKTYKRAHLENSMLF